MEQEAQVALVAQAHHMDPQEVAHELGLLDVDYGRHIEDEAQGGTQRAPDGAVVHVHSQRGPVPGVHRLPAGGVNALETHLDELLIEARNAPTAEVLAAGRARQQAVLDGLDLLLDRMDEWEDYQEVLTLVKSLIEDQKTLREASQRALNPSGGNR